MLDHSKAEPMGILRDVLCQVGVTTILARFLILDIPLDKNVPIVMGRSFLYTCGGIINTIKGTTSNFDGVCYQKYSMAAFKNKQEKKDNDDDEEITEERDENGKPFYGQILAKYLDCDNSIDLSLQHNEWMPSYADNSTRKVESDGTWHLKCSIVDPYGNEYN
ncbi:hypothetical protein Tco_1038085, partial [Tanacetum coccineum]